MQTSDATSQISGHTLRSTRVPYQIISLPLYKLQHSSVPRTTSIATKSTPHCPSHLPWDKDQAWIKRPRKSLQITPITRYRSHWEVPRSSPSSLAQTRTRSRSINRSSARHPLSSKRHSPRDSKKARISHSPYPTTKKRYSRSLHNGCTRNNTNTNSSKMTHPQEPWRNQSPSTSSPTNTRFPS